MNAPGPIIPNDFDEQMVASATLMQPAAEASKVLDTFASWALAGFGAALVLFITNTEARNWLGEAAMRASGKVFALAFILTAVEKYLAVMIQSYALGAASGRKAFVDHLELRGAPMPDFNNRVLVAHLESAVVWPGRSMARRMTQRVLKGDFMAGARRAMRLLQIQSLCVLTVVLLLVIAISNIAWR